ncbi:hypothetical protein GCM10010222_11340 [Streptomyces tanashiensis]|nr:hypothetical protein GCM10010222_11340 [Streptomyces tanashiensis]
MGDPPSSVDLHPPLVHEAFVLELPLGPPEGGCPDPGTFGGAGKTVAGALGEGELPGQKPNGVGGEPGMPNDVVRELGEAARGRVKVPVDHGGTSAFHEWFRPSPMVGAIDGGRFARTYRPHHVQTDTPDE